MKPQTVVYHRNGLGNLVLYTPAMQAMAAIDESGKVDFCIDSEWQDDRRSTLIDFAKELPFVNEIIN